MSDFTFKVGDKVYYPSATNEVLQVSSNFLVSYLGADDEGVNARINHGGKFYKFHHNPAFFPATQEWYDKLVHAYPDLEEPPAKKDPKEIILAMLDGGWNLVNYRIYSNAQQALNDTPKNKVITKSQYDVIDFNDYFNKYAYCNVEVIDPRTGKIIIDYVDGKVVLEDWTCLSI